jgi:hypothetical protein
LFDFPLNCSRRQSAFPTFSRTDRAAAR